MLPCMVPCAVLSFAKILSVRDFNRIQSCCPQAECDSKLA